MLKCQYASTSRGCKPRWSNCTTLGSAHLFASKYLLVFFRITTSSVEVSVFKYQPGVQTPVEQLHNYRISARGGAITGSLNQTEERRGENVSGSVDIAAGLSTGCFVVARLRTRLMNARRAFALSCLLSCSDPDRVLYSRTGRKPVLKRRKFQC